MFTRYNINDLYLAYVLDTTPNKNKDSIIPYYSVGYLTILKKSGETYTDLQNKGRIVTITRENQNERSYIIYEIEPLSKYYTQNGEKISKVTKKYALNFGKKYGHIITEKIEKRTEAI